MKSSCFPSSVTTRTFKQAYNSLLSRKVEADMAFNIQKKNKGEQFRIIDYAKLPEKPVSPNMLRLFLMFVAAGLALVPVSYSYMSSSTNRSESPKRSRHACLCRC